MKVEKPAAMACLFHISCGGCCSADCNALVWKWKLWAFWFWWLYHMGHFRVSYSHETSVPCLLKEEKVLLIQVLEERLIVVWTFSR
jgi:hypothetical protein